MAIYGCYTGKDMETYFCDLQLGNPRSVNLPIYRVAMGDPRRQTGTWQDLHPSTFWGSLTIVMRGQVEFGVTAGKVRSVIGKAGDMFVFVDTKGPGHSTHNPTGGEWFETVNCRLSDSIEDLWGYLQTAFTGWPENVYPPTTYAYGGPAEGRHAGGLDPKFDMKRFEQGK